MDLRQIEQFVAVAEHGSISAAAASLHMAQPPLSQAMARLERQLGIVLFTRTPRGITVTPEGAYLRDAGLRLLNHRERVEQNLQRMAQGLSADLHIAAGPLVFSEVVASRLATFSRDHPTIRLHLADPPPDELLERLSRGTVDLGFVSAANPRLFRHAWKERFGLRMIGRIPFVLAEAVGEKSGKRDLTSLMARPWILPAPRTGFAGFQDILQSLLEDVDVAPPRTVVEVPTP